MSESTQDMLTKQVDGAAEAIQEYARQIESGECGPDLDDVEPFDEPTIVDDYGNATPISEWPLAVEVKIGRPLSVLITAGGPHIEIAQDLSDGGAKLAGYWGGERVYRHGPEMQTVLDYFTDSLYDEAPEDYK